MSDLLDFQSRENFNFFKYSRSVTEDEKQGFLIDCQRVLEYAHATVKGMCLLGLRLKELKASETWHHVVDPNTNLFFTCDRFDDFCGYAFGFSKTKVSDLLNISQFVKLNGENVDFIDKRYAGYNTSQLVELGSISECDRKFFNSEMTVSEMRLVRNLLKTAYNSTWTPEEALTEAKRRAEAKSKPLPKNPDVLPGQITLTDLAGKEEVFEPEEPEEQADTSATACKSDVGTEEKQEASKFDLKNRAGRRHWLSHYTEWDSQYNRGYYPLFERVYHYNLKTGAVVYASESHVCMDAEKLTVYDAPRYYLKTELYDYPLQVTKDQLEKYMSLHVEEL